MPVSISADDRFAIYDMLGRYSRALDTADAQGYAALFTPDATLQIAGDEFHGRDAIREYIKQLTGVATWPGYRHHNTQVLFEEGDGQRCRVSCYSMIMWRHRSGEVESRQQGIYRDVFEKADDGLGTSPCAAGRNGTRTSWRATGRRRGEVGGGEFGLSRP